jgi:transglutaminase-like putative cysteine protease
MRIPALGLLLLSGCTSSSHTRSIEPVDTQREHRTFEFTYQASLPEIPAGAKEARLWVPIPVSTPDQKIEDVRITANHPYERNAIGNGSGDAVCVTSEGEPIEVEVVFTCTRYESKGGGKAAGAELRAALEPDAMIPLDGKVAAIAASLPTEGDTMATGKSLYQHTLERMKYDKPEGQSWGRGDAEWACDSRLGNCTDFHSYFIGLARAKKIPARFEMGFSVPAGGDAVAKIAGYHCWAYFWSNDHGWVPVDISEADKAQDKAEYYFGTLDENRVAMTGGRDVLLTPRPKKGALNFFVYPYAEVDGVEFGGAKRAFSRKNL